MDGQGVLRKKSPLPSRSRSCSTKEFTSRLRTDNETAVLHRRRRESASETAIRTRLLMMSW